MTTMNANEAAYANRYGYTDIIPYEIVRRISDKTIEVREMKAELDPTWKPEMTSGGFCGHTINNHDQRWIITPNTDNDVIRIRRTKRGWQAGGVMFDLAASPRKFHDFNF